MCIFYLVAPLCFLLLSSSVGVAASFHTCQEQWETAGHDTASSAEITFIIASTYRSSIKDTLASLSRQTLPNWLAIVVFNDVLSSETYYDPISNLPMFVSLDTTNLHSKVCFQYLQLNSSSNCAGRVRNEAIKLVHTPWVGFVDDDDTLDDRYVENLLQERQISPEADVVVFRMTNGVALFPPALHQNLYINSVGISFAARTALFDIISFAPSNAEDYYFLHEVRALGRPILLSAHVMYYIKNIHPSNGLLTERPIRALIYGESDPHINVSLSIYTADFQMCMRSGLPCGCLEKINPEKKLPNFIFKEENSIFFGNNVKGLKNSIYRAMEKGCLRSWAHGEVDIEILFTAALPAQQKFFIQFQMEQQSTAHFSDFYNKKLSTAVQVWDFSAVSISESQTYRSYYVPSVLTLPTEHIYSEKRKLTSVPSGVFEIYRMGFYRSCEVTASGDVISGPVRRSLDCKTSGSASSPHQTDIRNGCDYDESISINSDTTECNRAVHDDISIFSFGAMEGSFHRSRESICDDMHNELVESGHNVLCLYKVFGSMLDYFVSKSEIIVVEHYYQNSALETHRIDPLLQANKKVIVTQSADKQLERLYDGSLTICSRVGIIDCVKSVFSAEKYVNSNKFDSFALNLDPLCYALRQLSRDFTSAQTLIGEHSLRALLANEASVAPSQAPSGSPSQPPGLVPSQQPSVAPSLAPSVAPSLVPSVAPSQLPYTSEPSSPPSNEGKSVPSILQVSAASFSKSTVTVSAVLDSRDGLLVCKAYLSAQSYVPLSVSEILYNNRYGKNANFSSTFVIDNLEPSSFYDIYCLPVSDIGKLSDFKLIKAIKNVKTLCCRDVSINFASTIFRNNILDPFAVSLIFSGNAPLNLVLSFSTIRNSTLAVMENNIFTPSVIRFENNSRVGGSSYLAFIPNSLAGSFKLLCSLSGVSASDYSIEFSRGNIFSIVDSSAKMPAPILQSVLFSDDGTHLIATFDSFTDRNGRFNMFLCSELFVFSNPVDALVRCYWSNDISVIIYGRDFEIGHYIALREDILRAKCSAGTECNDWPTSTSITLPILAPQNPVLPIISIAAPSHYGPCDDIEIDLTTSSGNGGRPWSSATFEISSLNQNTSAAIQWLQSIDSRQISKSPVIFRAGILAPGWRYTISVELCNFLFACNNNLFSFYISSDDNVPVITILTRQPVQIQRNSRLQINANAVVNYCDGTTTSSFLKYSWFIMNNVDKTYGNNWSSSVNPKVFLVQPFTLSSNSYYTVSVIVKHGDMSSASSIDVAVLQGKVVVVLSVGYAADMKAGTSLTIDASKSYDEDFDELFGTAANLLFTFSCQKLKPTYSSICNLNLNRHLSSIDIIEPSTELVGSEYLLTTEVVHSLDGRSAQASTRISILNAMSPKVTILADSSTYLSANRKTKLVGQVEVPTSGTTTWTVDNPDFPLNQSSLSPIQSEFVYNLNKDGVQLLYFSLVLLPKVLSSASNLIFTLTCDLDNGYSSKASVLVQINMPPQPGYFICTPNTGFSLETPFTFSAYQWTDFDLPLSYEFGYLSQRSIFLASRSRLEYPRDKSILPAGYESANYTLIVRSRIYDSMGTMTYQDATVQVIKAPVSSLQLKSSILNSTVNTDETRKIITAVSLQVNAADCSLAPDCSALARKECSSFGTCGSCIDGYVGEEGNSNTKCVLISKDFDYTNLNVTDECHVDNDCHGVSSSCIAGHCSIPSKACPLDCSGSDHGVCVYKFLYDPSIYLDNCMIFDFNCVPVCECHENYKGISCEAANKDYLQLQQVRETLRKGLNVLIASENPSRETIMSWINMLVIMSTNQLDTTEQTKVDMIAMASSFIEKAALFELSYEEISELNSLMNILLPTKLLNVSFSSELYDASLNLLDVYAKFISNDMVVGQSDVSIVSGMFRLTSASVTNGKNYTLSTPATTLEAVMNKPRQGVNFYSPTTAAPFNFVLSETMSSLWNQSYQALLLQCSFDNLPYDETTNEFSIKTNFEFYPVVNDSLTSNRRSLTQEDTETETIYCDDNDFSSHFINCASGYNTSITCNGTSSAISVQCPSSSAVLMCTSTGTNSATCVVESYTSDSLVCSCSIKQNNASSTLHNDGSVQFAAMWTTVTSDFIQTWKSADELTLSEFVQSIKVFATLVSIAIASVIGMYWGTIADKKDSSVLDIETDAGIVETINSALPPVLRSNGQAGRKLIREIQVFHKWFGIFFSYMPYRPRAFRVVYLMSSFIAVLFVQSVIYHIVNPNDGTCDQLETEETCLQEHSYMSNSESKCEWSVTSQSCRFHDSEDSFKTTLYVAIITALIGTPIIILFENIIYKILCAETSATLSSQVQNNTNVSNEEHASIGVEFKDLMRNFNKYRDRLSPAEREHFDGKIFITYNFLFLKLIVDFSCLEV